jgi:cytochrome c
MKYLSNQRLFGLCLAGACCGMLSAQPTRAQFRTTVLMSNLADPTNLAFLPDGKIFVTSKTGTIWLYDPVSKATTTAATLNVSHIKEDGLHSIVLDPNFATTRWVYVYHATQTAVAGAVDHQSNVVERYNVLASDAIDVNSAVVIIRIPYSITQADEHNTGCLAFNPQGDLYIGLADNTNNFFSGPTYGMSPRDPARPNFDAQRSASNSNDWRGKVLRIHPEANGTYTIPAGNLFPPGTAKTKPEIYAMGIRHPFRITVDPKTGWLFWAEPGPNATADDANQGPRGYDVVQLAKDAGNYGWPYCRANNFCYKDYNYTTNVGGATYNPAALQNNSSNNTGIVNLPPGRPAIVWYPYNAAGTAFPIFGSGNNNTSMLGEVYHFDPAIANVNKIPLYYDNHLIILEFGRSLVHAVQFDNTGAVVAVKRFWDQTTANPVNNAIAMRVGPDGAFYFLGWGSSNYPDNAGNGNLVKLDYIGPPDAIVSERMTVSHNSEFKFVVFASDRLLQLPQGAVRVEFFDLSGKNVWNWRRAGNVTPASVALPGDVGAAAWMRVRVD